MNRIGSTLPAFSLALLIAALLLMPLGIDDSNTLLLRQTDMKMDIGDRQALEYMWNGEGLAEFSSDAPLIAAVDQDGLITAISPGAATITLRAGEQSVSANIAVSGVPVTHLSLSSESVHMRKGQLSKLAVSINANATDKRLIWTSENPLIVTVDESGQLAAVGGGTARITVSAYNGLSAQILVHVDVEAESVAIAPETLTVGVGAVIELRALFVPEDATDSISAWESTDSLVLTVDQQGVICAAGEGSARVRMVTGAAMVAYADVVVEAASAQSVAVLPIAIELPMGMTATLRASISPGGCANHYTLWESSDESVATVEGGVVIGTGIGTAQITAIVDGIRGAPSSITITAAPGSLALEPSELNISAESVNSPIRLNAVFSDEAAREEIIFYSSDNERVAIVDSNGVVTFTGAAGEAVITASTAGGASAQCEILVVEDAQ